MNIQLKQRLLLAIVMLALVIIFVPMLFRRHTNGKISSLAVFPQVPVKPEVEKMTSTLAQQPLVAKQPVVTQTTPAASTQVGNEIKQSVPAANSTQLTPPASSEKQMQSVPVNKNVTNVQSDTTTSTQEPSSQTKSINSAQPSVVNISRHSHTKSSASKVLSVKPSNIPVSASIQNFALSQSELNNIANHVQVRNDNVNSNNVLPEITSAQKKQLKTAQSFNKAWVVQLGSFANKNNAAQLVKKLRKKEFTAFAYPVRQNHIINYRVYVGPMVEKAQAKKLSDRIKKETKIDSFVAKFDPTSLQ